MIKELPDLYARDAKVVWILDSGHGKNTPGKRSPVWNDCSILMEWAFNREMSELIHKIGRENGLRVHLLVQEDEDIALNLRVDRQKNLSNLIKNDHKTVLISNHANAADVESASGIEVFTSVGETESDKVADLVLIELFKAFPDVRKRIDTTDGDMDKEAHFYILKHTSCPAILIEYGFMTNELECKRLMDSNFRETAALAVVDAMMKYEDII